jgi:hypothetical protein
MGGEAMKQLVRRYYDELWTQGRTGFVDEHITRSGAGRGARSRALAECRAGGARDMGRAAQNRAAWGGSEGARMP